MRDAFVKTLMRISAEDKHVMLVTGDLGFGVLKPFWEAFPNQFINAGIAEQAMTGIAAGMALEGKKVFTYSIANFPTFRCLEQIRNDIAYHNANVKIVSVGAGFSYGALGMSHHAIEDIAIMRSLPNMVVFTPCDPIETIAAVNNAVEYDGPCYLRLGRGGEKKYHSDDIASVLGKSFELKPGKDTAILCAGGIIDEALQATENLKNLDISCAVYSFPTIKPIDKECIFNLINKYRYIFTLEEHNIIAGFGSTICEIVSEWQTSCMVIRIGIPDEYCSAVGSQNYLRHIYGLTSSTIADKIIKTINNVD